MILSVLYFTLFSVSLLLPKRNHTGKSWATWCNYRRRWSRNYMNLEMNMRNIFGHAIFAAAVSVTRFLFPLQMSSVFNTEEPLLYPRRHQRPSVGVHVHREMSILQFQSVLSPFGTCMCSNVETNLAWTCLVSGPLKFEPLGTSLLLLVFHVVYHTEKVHTTKLTTVAHPMTIYMTPLVEISQGSFTMTFWFESCVLLPILYNSNAQLHYFVVHAVILSRDCCIDRT